MTVRAEDEGQKEETSRQETAPLTYSRRDALRAVSKYSAFLAGTSAVVMTASQANAKKACSQIGGNGNGNAPKPGKGPPWCR